MCVEFWGSRLYTSQPDITKLGKITNLIVFCYSSTFIYQEHE